MIALVMSVSLQIRSPARKSHALSDPADRIRRSDTALWLFRAEYTHRLPSEYRLQYRFPAAAFRTFSAIVVFLYPCSRKSFTHTCRMRFFVGSLKLVANCPRPYSMWLSLFLHLVYIPNIAGNRGSCQGVSGSCTSAVWQTRIYIANNLQNLSMLFRVLWLVYPKQNKT